MARLAAFTIFDDCGLNITESWSNGVSRSPWDWLVDLWFSEIVWRGVWQQELVEQTFSNAWTDSGVLLRTSCMYVGVKMVAIVQPINKSRHNEILTPGGCERDVKKEPQHYVAASACLSHSISPRRSGSKDHSVVLYPS
jgi:hypothetical protein